LYVLPEAGIGVSCGADGTTFSWTLDRGERVRSFAAHTAIVNDLAVDPAGQRVATVGRDFVLNVYELEEGRLLQALPLSRRSPKAVAFADPQAVIVGDYWGHVARVSLVDGRRRERRIAANGISSLSPQGTGRLAASSYDGALYLVDAATLDVVEELRAMTQRQPLVSQS
jgi:WD40 repeat protein